MNLRLLALAPLLAASTASAVTIGLGTKEISLSGNLDVESAVGTDIAINLGLGYAVMDNVLVGGTISVQNNDLYTAYDIGGYGEYNFETYNNWMPFAGARLSWGGNDPDPAFIDSVDAIVLKPYGGIKYFFGESVAAFAEFGWSLATDDLYLDNDGNAESMNYGILLGLRVYIP